MSVVGVRSWAVRREEDGGWRLDAYAYTDLTNKTGAWRGPVTDAVCAAGDVVTHAAPQQGCTCGIWASLPEKVDAFFETRGIADPRLQDGRVFGTIEAFGRIVKGELGFRAEQAMVTGFIAPRCEGQGRIRGGSHHGPICGEAATIAGVSHEQVEGWYCASHADDARIMDGSTFATLRAAAAPLPIFVGVKFGARCSVYKCRLKVYRYRPGTKVGWCQSHDHLASPYGHGDMVKFQSGPEVTVGYNVDDILAALRMRYDVPRLGADALDDYYAA